MTEPDETAADADAADERAASPRSEAARTAKPRVARPRWRRWARWIGLGLLGLLAFVLIRATLLSPEPYDPGPAPAIPSVDAEAVARRLAAAVRIATLSPGGERPGDTTAPRRDRVEAMLALHRQLEADFPLVHERLQHETVNTLSRLYHWPGTDPSAEPILLTAHLDVVPVEPGTEEDWTQPPFSGAIVDGVVWGRGALDDKTGAVGILQAVELLLADGFAPRRTIVIALGHDEEVGGREGAVVLAQTLKARGEHFAFLVDEGGVIISETIPGLEPAVALVGIAEKGYAEIELTLEAEGGHASMPAKTGALGRLAAAVGRIEDNPMPSDLRGPTRAMLEGMAPHMSFAMRVPMANLWLLEPVIERVMLLQPPSAASVRTTLAPTMFRSGVAPNVLAGRATLTVNSRILPGETVQDVLDHLRAVVDDPAIEIACTEQCWNPSPVAALDGEGYATVRRAIAHVFPDAATVPSLVVGATDARHYVEVARDAYRFLPIRFRGDDRTRIHGTDEQITVEGFANAVRFYMTLMKLAAG